MVNTLVAADTLFATDIIIVTDTVSLIHYLWQMCIHITHFVLLLLVYISDSLSVVDALLMADALCTVDTFSALHILYYYGTYTICSRHNICDRHIIWQICTLLIIYTLFKADTYP